MDKVMTEFESKILSEQRKTNLLLEGIAETLKTIAAQNTTEAAPDSRERKTDDCLTDADCIKILADTGFIKRNTNIKNKVVYATERAVTAPNIYNKLLEMIGDGERAKRIMLNNISDVESIRQYIRRQEKKVQKVTFYNN
jgi:hypothetical protein